MGHCLRKGDAKSRCRVAKNLIFFRFLRGIYEMLTMGRYEISRGNAVRPFGMKVECDN